MATTAGQPWDGAGSTESTVYVLTESGGQLRQLGKVGGLGKGERIYAVRFIGTTGYVVTFRRPTRSTRWTCAIRARRRSPAS